MNKTKPNIAEEKKMKKTELPGIPRTKWSSQESPRKQKMEKTKLPDIQISPRKEKSEENDILPGRPKIAKWSRSRRFV